MERPPISFAFLRSGRRSKTSTFIPFFAKRTASKLPTNPAPTTATFFSFIYSSFTVLKVFITFSIFLKMNYQNKHLVFVWLVSFYEKQSSFSITQDQESELQRLERLALCILLHY